VVGRDYIGLPITGAKYAERLDLAAIGLTFAATMILGRGYGEHDGSSTNGTGLALNSSESPALLNHKVVAGIVAERD